MNLTASATTHLNEVFRTETGCVYQSDRESCFFVEFVGKTLRYKVKCFFRLKAAVERIDLARMATDTNRAADVEVISLCACEHCYVLTLPQIIALQELLAGAAVMLELNSILHERLYRVVLRPV